MSAPPRIVWFHRGRALMWACVGVASFVFGWADSVVLVWIASLYANISTDWGNAEAADDRAVLDELCTVRAENDRILTALAQLTEEVRRGHH